MYTPETFWQDPSFTNSETLNARILWEKPDEYSLKSEIDRILSQFWESKVSEEAKQRLWAIAEKAEKVSEETNDWLSELYFASVVRKHQDILWQEVSALQDRMKSNIANVMNS